MPTSNSKPLAIDPRLLTRLSSIDLRSRNVVEGLYNNCHRTRDFGTSSEFMEYREYRMGDDIRSIDWRVFARTDQYHIRLHEMESIMRVGLMVDCSSSMQIPATHGLPSKMELASIVAGAIATVAVNRQDAAGLGLFDDRLATWIPSRQGQTHLFTLYQHLGATGAADGTPSAGAFGSLLGQAVGRLGRRGLIFIITDALDDPTSLYNALKLLRVRENDVALIQILDDREVNFPFEQMTEFRHPGSDQRVICNPMVERERYLEALAAHNAELESFCNSTGVDYLRLSTGDDLLQLLSLYFLRRLMGS